MDMSPACTMPPQPSISAADREHPLFPLYSQYRSFCNAKMIECNTFANWLYQYEQDLRFKEIEKHPRFAEWQAWMQANKGGARKCPAGVFPHNFHYWLEGGRW